MTKIASLSFCFSACVLSSMFAQEEPPPAATEARAAVIVRAEASGDGQGVQTIELATSDGGGDFFTFASGPGGGFMFGGGNPMEASEFLLNNAAVQKDLEILDEQREQLRQMQSEFGNELKSAIDNDMKNGGPGKARIGELIQEINKRKKDRLAEILLPHQVDRLKQISLQNSVNQAGLGHALASKALAEELGIDKEQQEALAKKAEELAKEFEEKVAKIKADMREELMEQLKPEQREKVKALLGQKFEFENQPGHMMLPPRALRNPPREATSSDN